VTDGLPSLEDFGFNTKELLLDLSRETMGKLIAAEKKIAQLQAAIDMWAMANFPEKRPDPHDLEGRAALEQARSMAEATLYNISCKNRD
jgi:hypothetical protein